LAVYAPQSGVECCGTGRVVRAAEGLRDIGAVVASPCGAGTVASVATQHGQHARARIADKGWRLPRDLRKSAMSEKTSMSGRGCAIRPVDLDERVWGHRGPAGQAKPHVAQNPLTRYRLDLQPLSEN